MMTILILNLLFIEIFFLFIIVLISFANYRYDKRQRGKTPSANRFERTTMWVGLRPRGQKVLDVLRPHAMFVAGDPDYRLPNSTSM